MPIHFSGNAKEIQALEAFVKLMRASETVATQIHRHLAETGLTPTQFGVLEILYHLGPLCQRDLGTKILKSSGNVTAVIGHLEKRDLVARQRNSRDRRFFTVRLTSGGKELVRTIFPRHLKEIVREFSVLSAEEQKELARLCRKLGRKDPG